jgi:tRNA(fMet)-specific endonuclease VapC
VLLSLFEISPLDLRVCEVFGPLSAELKKKGVSIGDFDEVIAATALCHDGVLITRDDHFSQVPGIEVVGY